MLLRKAAVAAALSMLAAACTATGDPATGPPAAVTAPARAGADVETVRLASSDPDGFAALLDGAAPERPVEAALYLPALRPAATAGHRLAGRRLPAVVVLHGPDGPDERTDRYARALAAAGIAALVPDGTGSRHLRAHDPDGALLPLARQVADAAAAWRLLAGDPRFDAGRIGVMGMGRGGSAALLAAHTPFLRASAGPHAAFAAHLPVTPSCEFRPDRWRPVGAAILLVLGEEDPVGSPEACVPVAEALQAAGAAVATKIYAGAHHAFDRGPGLDRPAGRRATKSCWSTIDEKGRMALAGPGIAAGTALGRDWPGYRRAVLERCGAGPVVLGAGQDLRGNVAADAVSFFTETLKPGRSVF